MGRLGATVGLVLGLAVASLSQVRSTVRLDEVQKSLRDRGARLTVEALFSDVAKWDAVLDHIATGNRSWLVIAQALEPGVDAHTAETLVMAVAEALTVAPGPTLRILHGPLLNPDRVCISYGFLEYREDVKDAEVLVSLQKRALAVRSVVDPGEAAAQKQCLVQLKAVQEHLRKGARGGA